MKLFNNTNDFLNFRKKLTENGIGLVPTMGNLHQGHLNLVKEALKENERVIVTIFVNPKQFGPNEDFEKYPRTLENDVAKLGTLEKADGIIVFAPSETKEIFPDGYSTDIEVKGLDDVLCGRNRPGHFKGVTTVVYRLFALTKPSKAYFGQKDFQQFKIIQRMTRDLSLPIELMMVPIARESSGLALSSRNQYLSPPQMEESLTLNQTLKKLAKTVLSKSVHEGISQASEILTFDSRFQYLSILDSENLREPNENTQEVVVAGAFLLGDTRLIDNILISLKV